MHFLKNIHIPPNIKRISDQSIINTTVENVIINKKYKKIIRNILCEASDKKINYINIKYI